MEPESVWLIQSRALAPTYDDKITVDQRSAVRHRRRSGTDRRWRHQLPPKPSPVEASGFAAGPSVVLLAAPAVVEGHKAWTSFTYDPRREATSSAFIAEGGEVRKDASSA